MFIRATVAQGVWATVLASLPVYLFFTTYILVCLSWYPSLFIFSTLPIHSRSPNHIMSPHTHTHAHPLSPTTHIHSYPLLTSTHPHPPIHIHPSTSTLLTHSHSPTPTHPLTLTHLHSLPLTDSLVFRYYIFHQSFQRSPALLRRIFLAYIAINAFVYSAWALLILFISKHHTSRVAHKYGGGRERRRGERRRGKGERRREEERCLLLMIFFQDRDFLCNNDIGWCGSGLRILWSSALLSYAQSTSHLQQQTRHLKEGR